MALIMALFAVCIGAILVHVGTCQTTFAQQFVVSWGGVNIHPNDTNDSVEIALTSDGMGATFSTNATYLFGSFKVQAKLVQGDSAGTVAAFFLISATTNHDEIDFEFLGNLSGQPYLLHTNLFANGVGDREQDTYLWFDPTADFHTYQVLWNHEQIVWLVDDIPIRLHVNIQNIAPNTFPTFRPMIVSACIFDASTWATEGGAVPIDYEDAPFTVTFQNFLFNACAADGDQVGNCASNYTSNWWEAASYQTFSSSWANQLAWVHQHYLHYDYCTDTTRNPTPPIECSYNAAASQIKT